MSDLENAKELNPKELKLGIAGLGTVGASVVRLLAQRRADLAARTGRTLGVTAVSARDKSRDRGIDLNGVTFHYDPVEVARDPQVDVVVELIGGADGPAYDTVKTALELGKPVVTANKALIARHGAELSALAEEKGVALAFEAAVAGGIPVIRVLREAMAGNEISRVYGILNGTCNYILTRMEQEQLSYGECLKAAQELGYAEADPTFDVEGFDTAHKLAILASLAFGSEVAADKIYIEGISSISRQDIEAAHELGYRIKLLGVARKTETGIEQRVHPTMVPKSSAIAGVDGVLNAVAVEGDAVGSIVLVGPGAGGMATASSVVADLSDIARGSLNAPFGRPGKTMLPFGSAEIDSHSGAYYVRMSVYDRPGALAGITTRMAENGISLESIVQRRTPPHVEHPRAGQKVEAQSVILITYPTTEKHIRAAFKAISDDGNVETQPQLIRIEEL